MRWRCCTAPARHRGARRSSRSAGATSSAPRCCCATCSPTTPSAPTSRASWSLCEHEGDRIAHDIIHRLKAATRGRARRWTRIDGYQLATALDDIVDYAEQAADNTGPLRGRGADGAGRRRWATCSSAPASRSRGALRCAAHGRRPRAATSSRSTAWRTRATGISRDGVASLFVNGIDPMVVIRWKDIFESLEASVDACEHVAHVLEGISLRRRAVRWPKARATAATGDGSPGAGAGRHRARPPTARRRRRTRGRWAGSRDRGRTCPCGCRSSRGG